jgi:hypothetical protein
MRSYREQLYVPVSYWLLSVPVVVLLGAEVFVGFSTLVAALVYVAFVVVVGGFLLSWGATRIEVTGTVLKAGGDILSLSQVSEVLPLDDKEAALLRGPRANPAAHLLLRPYLKRAVYIGLPDSLDGVPYWLVGTRHPNELAVALTDAATLTDTALTDTGPAGAGRPTTDPARRDANGLSGPGQRRGMIPGSEAQGLPAATGTRTRRNDDEAAG